MSNKTAEAPYVSVEKALANLNDFFLRNMMKRVRMRIRN